MPTLSDSLFGALQAPLDLAQHKDAAVGRHRAAIKPGVDFISFHG